MENKKQSEIIAVEDLIQLLDLSEVVLTMDALHCQKADATPRRRQAQDKGFSRMYAHQAKPLRRLPMMVTTT